MNIGEKLKEKSREITGRLSQQYREHIGEELADKAQALRDHEASLNQREKDISGREERLAKYYLVPRLYVQLPLFIAFCAGAFFIYNLVKSPVSESGARSVASSVPASSSAPAPRDETMNVQEAAVYGIYNDIDATDPNFDVGNYCLNKEKEGVVTFEQCIVVAASKIAPK